MAVKSCPSWSQLYSVNFPEYSGYVTNLEDAIKLIKVYGVNKTTSSIIAYQTKGFRNSQVGKTRYCKFDISIIFLFVFFLSSFHWLICLFIYCIFLPPLYNKNKSNYLKMEPFQRKIGSISVTGQLPTYPSPNSISTLTCCQLTVVEGNFLNFDSPMSDIGEGN